MRKIVLLSLVFAFFFAAVAQAGEKIAVFDKHKVLTESDALAVAREALDNKFGAQRAGLEREHAELERIAVELQRQAPTEQQIQTFMRQQEEFSEKAQVFMRLLQIDEERVRRDIDALINRAAKDLAERKGYVLVLDSMAVSYFEPKLDVTAEMLNETNALWKKEAGL